jgi:predicted nucleotidyltransferase
MSKQKTSMSDGPITLDKIVSTLRDHRPELQRRFGICSLGVFGSYVRGEQKRGSDLDILVEFDDRVLSLFDFVEIEHYMSDLLGVKVDLVEKSTLKPAIGRHVLEEVLTV